MKTAQINRADKEVNHNVESYIEALDLCIKIQNEGIGTAFYRGSGHCNHVQIDIHIPRWYSGHKPDHEFYIHGEKGSYASNKKAIDALKNILKEGAKDALEEQIRANKAQEKKKAQYLALKKEFEPTTK